jgi:hypothetical protein
VVHRMAGHALGSDESTAFGQKWGKEFGYAFLQNLAEPSCPMLLGCHIALFLGRGVPKTLGSDEVEKWGMINGKLRVWGSLFHSVDSWFTGWRDMPWAVTSRRRSGGSGPG